MSSDPASLETYRAEVLAASVKILGSLGIVTSFPTTHDPADIVLDTLERIATSVGDANSGSTQS
jgi:hypothetical protein